MERMHHLRDGQAGQSPSMLTQEGIKMIKVFQRTLLRIMYTF